MALHGLMILTAALAGEVPAPAGAAELVSAAAEGVGGGARDESYAPATARIVGGIIEYTRWPAQAGPLTLCAAGPTRRGGRLDAVRLADGRAVQRREVAPVPSAIGGCQVLYIGDVQPLVLRQLVAAARGNGVLTIAEADPACRSQAMFCMVYEPRAVSFRMNLDAIARSGLRVDPRVLRLAEGGR
jgi:hypothetical protein